MKIALITTGVRDFSDSKVNYLKAALPDVTFSCSPEVDFAAEMIIGYPGALLALSLSNFPHLKAIQLLSVGYDTLDLAYLKARSIRLFTAYQTSSTAISEFVIGQILNVNYELSFYKQKQAEKEWYPCYNARGLLGAQALILGTGAIGGALAQRLSSFGVSVTGFRRNPAIPPHFVAVYTDLANVKANLSEFDYIISALPLSKETTNLIDYSWFLKMKKSALFINVARGALVNKSDLERALNEVLIRGAILDVMTAEPLPRSSTLWELPNVFITPHIAYYNNQTIDNIIALLVSNIQRYLVGEPIQGEISL